MSAFVHPRCFRQDNMQYTLFRDADNQLMVRMHAPDRLYPFDRTYPVRAVCIASGDNLPDTMHRLCVGQDNVELSISLQAHEVFP